MSSLRKTSLWVCLAAAALFAASCGDDDGGGTADARPGADAASTGDAGAPTVYTVPLTKTEEVPVCTAAGASAAGMATVTIPADNSSIMVTAFTYTGLSGAPSMAHIHFGDTGVMGPVVFPFTGLTSPISATFTAAGYTPPGTGGPSNFAAFVTEVKNGNAYLNIHTAACGSGEIRGQID